MIAAVLAFLAATPAPAVAACTWSNAEPADVREMARDPERWLGRCVRLQGYVVRNQFYADAAGFYRYFARDYRDRRNDGWLGLYPSGRYGYGGAMRRGSIVGLVHDCETDRARAGAEARDAIILMGGFCHYRYGLVLRRVSFHPGGRSEFERQMGEEARRSFGDLVEGNEAGPVPAQVQALASRFLTAVRGADEGTLRGLVEFWAGADPDDRRRTAAAETAFLRGERNSSLESLRDGPSSPHLAYFRERTPRDGRSPDEPGEWHACFCRVADCTGIWPISRFDANADPSRPYVCVAAYPENNRSTYGSLGIVRDHSYPIEPARTAFRRQSESFRR